MRLSESSAPWVALQVRPRMEKTTAQHLEFRGYEYFLPLRRSADSTESREETPLFPGYVFCRFAATASAPIISTPGVTRIVAFGGMPAYVDEGEIEAIRRALASGQAVWPVASFEPGTPVFIETGPLGGLSGTVLGMNDKHYLIVSISLLQRSIAVELDPRWVRPAAARSDPRPSTSLVH
jgi:transcriptional antiterminator NusG